MLPKCLTNHLQDIFCSFIHIYAASCKQFWTENFILKNVVTFRGPHHLIKGPDNPTSQLLPIMSNKCCSGDGEGRKNKGGGGGLRSFPLNTSLKPPQASKSLNLFVVGCQTSRFTEAVQLCNSRRSWCKWRVARSKSVMYWPGTFLNWRLAFSNNSAEAWVSSMETWHSVSWVIDVAMRWIAACSIGPLPESETKVLIFFCPSPLPFGGSTGLSLTRGLAGNRTTTGSLSATQECRDTNCTTRTIAKPRFW